MTNLSLGANQTFAQFWSHKNRDQSNRKKTKKNSCYPEFFFVLTTPFPFSLVSKYNSNKLVTHINSASKHEVGTNGFRENIILFCGGYILSYWQIPLKIMTIPFRRPLTHNVKRLSRYLNIGLFQRIILLPWNVLRFFPAVRINQPIYALFTPNIHNVLHLTRLCIKYETKFEY